MAQRPNSGGDGIERGIVAGGNEKAKEVAEIMLGQGAAIAALLQKQVQNAERIARFGLPAHQFLAIDEQLQWARSRLDGAGLASQGDLRLQDYRDLAAEGVRYDAVVSVEMFEAVGRAYWPSFFQTLGTCLAPGGKACVQTIVVRDDLF